MRMPQQKTTPCFSGLTEGPVAVACPWRLCFYAKGGSHTPTPDTERAPELGAAAALLRLLILMEESAPGPTDIPENGPGPTPVAGGPPFLVYR
jgi:hypothetical protein